jgi:hypothetical protein
LVSFVDYSSFVLEDNDAVLLRVGPLFMQFNRAKDYNIDTGSPDAVTVTEVVDGQDYSNALAALSKRKSIVYPDFNGSGYDLVIEICDLVINTDEGSLDYAMVSTHLNDGLQESQCAYQPTVAPTAKPIALHALDVQRCVPKSSPDCKKSQETLEKLGLSCSYPTPYLVVVVIVLILLLTCLLMICCRSSKSEGESGLSDK